MKILHLITGLSRGGAEHMLYKLLSSMDRKRFDPVVVSLISGGVYTDKITALGIPVHTLGMRAGISSLWALLRLRRLVKQIDPDVVHAWMYHAGLIALLVTGGRPVIVGIRSALSDIGREKFLTRQVITGLRRMSRRAARICYNSRVSRQQHEAAGYDSGHGLVIPNGFDCVLYRSATDVRVALRATLGLAPDAFVIGHLGRYHPVKDHQTLLAAFALLSRDHPKVHLVMAGAGVDPANAALSNEITALGLEGRVHLLGERDDVPELINIFDVLANSSRSEAFPNVLGEAMACAVPCVATDAGDSAFIIGDTGVVAPPNDPKTLAGALARMADMDLADRIVMGAWARTRVIKHFSLSKIARDYEEIYETVKSESLKKSDHSRVRDIIRCVVLWIFSYYQVFSVVPEDFYFGFNILI
jgi:glycosyltransferase involved in cell wall biosynthesis